MSWSDFYIQSGASDLNAGSTNANAAAYTCTASNWDGTSVFTPTDGSTPANSVNVGDYASIYATGATVVVYVAQVTNVAAGVNGAITLSTTIKYGTVPTSNSGSRNIKVGGAWATPNGPATSGSPLNTGTTAPQSTRINMKVQTTAMTTTSLTWSLPGSATVGVWFRGYKTTPGDQDANNVAVAGTDIPSITFTTGSMTGPARAKISNLDLSGAPSAYLLTTGQSGVHYRVRSNNTSTNASAGAVNSNSAGTGAGSQHVGCYYQSASSGASACVNCNSNTHIVGSIVKGGVLGAQVNNQSSIFLYHTVFDSQAGDAIKVTTGTCIVANCSIYAPTGNGIIVSSTGFVYAYNNYFENVNQASKAAINNTSGTNTDAIYAVGNAYFNCTANISGITESFTIFDNGTLGSAGFVAPGSQNFAPNQVLWAISFPGTFENTSAYQGYFDVGAVQHVALPASSSSCSSP